MRRPLVLPMSLIALAFASTGSTHETVPQDWCLDKGTTPEIVDLFAFDGDALKKQVIKCGIVDSSDHWTQASRAVAMYCAEQGDARPFPLPFVSGPSSYTSRRHHEDYRLDDGLSGACAVCVSVNNKP
jgi:hypothetical protein